MSETTGSSENVARGPVGRPPTRSRDEIAHAAVELADRDGLALVTMRAVASSLGTGAASLYRYVRTRDDLVALMVDEVNGEFDLTGPDKRPWVEQMVDLARRARAVYRRHPWMIDALDRTPTLGPNSVAYLEHALAVLSRTRADGGTKLEAVGVFGGVVRLLARQERDARLAGDAVAADELAHHLTTLAASNDYPHLSAALTDTHDSGDQFDRIVRRVITGLITSSP